MKQLHYIAAILMVVATSSVGTAQHRAPQGGSFMMIPALHGLHKVNKSYSYDSVKAIIARFSPDIIAVEIRAEDIDSDSTYLLNNYPLEMVMMKYWFPRCNVVGFDWLGTDLEGRPIPHDYWTSKSKIKQLERALDKDTLYSKITKECSARFEERMAILKTASYSQLIASPDAQISKMYYSCLAEKLKHTPYQPLTDFYETRNQKILANIRMIYRKNTAKRILVITGDDHYIYMKDKLSFVEL
jgi:hypothetical protein